MFLARVLLLRVAPPLFKTAPPDGAELPANATASSDGSPRM